MQWDSQIRTPASCAVSPNYLTCFTITALTFCRLECLWNLPVTLQQGLMLLNTKEKDLHEHLCLIFYFPELEPFLLLLFYLFIFVLGPLPTVFMGYFWLFIKELLLVGLGGPYGVPRIISGLTACKGKKPYCSTITPVP